MTALKKKIDAFQLNGLRQILQIQTTSVDRSNSNEVVFRRANECVKQYEIRKTDVEGKLHKLKHRIPISEHYEDQRRKFVIEVIGSTPDDPIPGACADNDIQLVEHTGKRVGRPRNNWWVNAVINYWECLRQHQFEQFGAGNLDWNNTAHIAFLKRATAQKFGSEKGE